jgi:hypothetical protein
MNNNRKIEGMEEGNEGNMEGMDLKVKIMTVQFGTKR